MIFSDRMKLADVESKWANGFKISDDDVRDLLDIIKNLDDKLDSIKNNN